MRKARLHLALALALVSSPALLLFAPRALAQGTPSVKQAYTGATMVSGKATPGQAPVTIYDTTTSVRATLGTSQSVDKMGNFAVIVTPPLVAGHSIVVVDRSGAASPAMVVTARPSSSSHQ